MTPAETRASGMTGPAAETSSLSLPGVTASTSRLATGLKRDAAEDAERDRPGERVLKRDVALVQLALKMMAPSGIVQVDATTASRARARSVEQVARRAGWPIYPHCMSASRDETPRPDRRVTDDQVAAVLADVKKRTTPPPPRSSEPFARIGMIKDGPTNASSPEAIDAVLAQGFGR